MGIRLFLDASILMKGVTFPRLPFEVLRLGLQGEAEIVLSPLVVEAARIHISEDYPLQLPLFEQVLADLKAEVVPDPAAQEVAEHRHICRDESDVPVALAAIRAGVDYLVTTDKDLTVEDESTVELRRQVNVITPLALLRHVLRWSEDAIEAAIHRNWNELSAEDRRGLGP
jgi:predicted nucleic acid-binding protein